MNTPSPITSPFSILRRIFVLFVFAALFFPEPIARAQSSAIIRGRVIDATGQPLADVTVSLYRLTGSTRESSTHAQTNTDVNGDYVFTALPPDIYDLMFLSSSVVNSHMYVRTINYHNKLRSAEADRIALTDGEDRTLEDTEIPYVGRIVGRVVNRQGQGLEGIKVQLLHWGAHDIAVKTSTITASDGQYALYVQYPSSMHYLYFDDPTNTYMDEYYDNRMHFSASNERVNVATNETLTVNVDLSLVRQIRGTVTDSQGQPIKGIAVWELDANRSPDSVYLGTPTITDENGQYVINSLLPKKYQLLFGTDTRFIHDELFVEEYYNDKQTYVNGDIIDLTYDEYAIADAVLTRFGTVSGRVTDKYGEPIPKITVTFFSLYKNKWSFSGGDQSLTDENGYFQHPLNPRYEYRIRFSSYQGSSTAPFVTEYYPNARTIETAQSFIVPVETNLSNIDIQLERFGVITGTIVDQHGNPVPNAAINAIDPTGSWQGTRYSDAAGQYRLYLPSEEPYRISFAHGTNSAVFYNNQSSLDASNPITVAFDTTLPNINAQLLPGAVVSGTVTDINGKTLPGIRIFVYEGNTVKTSILTNENGNYSFGVASGTYRLGFNLSTMLDYREDYQSKFYQDDVGSTSVVLAAGESRSLNIVLDISPSISGYMLMANGEPALDGIVTLYRRQVLNGQSTWNVISSKSARNSDGYYKFPNLSPSEYLLFFAEKTSPLRYRAEYYDNQLSQDSASIVTIQASTPLTNINGIMDAYGVLAITVIDANNNPLSGIEILPYSAYNRTGQGINKMPVYVTDQNGRAYISVYEPYWLEFRDPNNYFAGHFYNNKPNLVDSEHISVSIGLTENVTVELGLGASISGRMTTIHGAPAANASIQLYTHWPYSAVFPYWRATRFSTYTDVNGNYQIDGLTPGTRYRMRVVYNQEYFYPSSLPNHLISIDEVDRDIVIPSDAGIFNIDMTLLSEYEVLANFSASAQDGSSPLMVDFLNESSAMTWAQISSNIWDFGDGATSTEKNPSHTYTQAGSYTVTLTVNSDRYSDSEIKANYIVVSDTEIAEVSIAQLGGNEDSPPTVGETLSFSATATGSNVQFLWDFGDSASAMAAASTPALTPVTGQYVQHVYATPGDYTITLTARNGTSEMVTTQQITIQGADTADAGTPITETPSTETPVVEIPGTETPVTEPPATETPVAETPETDTPDTETASGDTPVSALSINAPSKLLVGQSVNLSASVGSGSNVAYSWDFGDGNIGTGANVSHSYTASGTYTIKVTASNGAGAVEAEVQIVVEHGLHIPRLGR